MQAQDFTDLLKSIFTEERPCEIMLQRAFVCSEAKLLKDDTIFF